MTENPLLIILGPTASGKTRLAVQLANTLKGEIISADSRQIFRGMDIGTGKDLEEYQNGGRQIFYHLIDIKDPGEKYQVDAFKEDFYRIFEKLTANHLLPVLCGGTGMYVHSLLQNHEFTAIPVNADLRSTLVHLSIDELRRVLNTFPLEFTRHADQSTVKRLTRAIEIASYLMNNKLPQKIRPVLTPLVIGLTGNVESRRKRIESRLNLRLQQGLIEEVEYLLNAGISKEMLIFYGLEYKFVISYLSGELSLEALRERLFFAICQYAKRQMTFFRKMEKDGVKIHWFDADLEQDEIKTGVVELYLQIFGN